MFDSQIGAEKFAAHRRLGLRERQLFYRTGFYGFDGGLIGKIRCLPPDIRPDFCAGRLKPGRGAAGDNHPGALPDRGFSDCQAHAGAAADDKYFSILESQGFLLLFMV